MADITTNIFNLNNRNTPVLQKSYNDFQNELLRLDTHNSLVGSVNQLREDRIDKNRVNINNIDADLMTTRRQVEIIQNRNLIKEDIIYILRALFVFIGVTVISYVYLEGTVYRQPVLFALGAIAIYYFGGKALSFLSRSANRWSMTNWDGIKYATPVKAPEEDVCAAENAAYEAQMAKIKGKILDKMIAMKTRFNKLDRNKKLLHEKREKLVNDYGEIIEKADLIFDKLPKDKQTIILDAKKKDIAKEPRTIRVQPRNPADIEMETRRKNDGMIGNSSSKLDEDKPMSKPDRIKMMKMVLNIMPYPINLLNNDKDIETLSDDRFRDDNASKEQMKTMLKAKGISEADIVKGFNEVNKMKEDMKKK